jgi:hypothetical protein
VQFVLQLDADDWLEPSALERVLEEFTKNPGLGGAFALDTSSIGDDREMKSGPLKHLRPEQMLFYQGVQVTCPRKTLPVETGVLSYSKRGSGDEEEPVHGRADHRDIEAAGSQGKIFDTFGPEGVADVFQERASRAYPNLPGHRCGHEAQANGPSVYSRNSCDSMELPQDLWTTRWKVYGPRYPERYFEQVS